MGKYQDFVLDLLKEIMTPCQWMSIDEVNSRLIDLRTKSRKKYVQIPTKHSLAQQMCRFFTKEIKVRKDGPRNMYLLRALDTDMIEAINEIRVMSGVAIDTWPEDWVDNRHQAQEREALRLWNEYRFPPEEPEDDEVFEMWFD